MQLFLVPVMYDRIGRNKLRALEGFITQKEIQKNIDLVSLLGSYILDCFFEFFLTEYGHFASVAEKNRIMKKVHLIFHFFWIFSIRKLQNICKTMI